VAVIAIKRGRDPILNPAKDEVLQVGDMLVVGSKEGALDQGQAK
jgi:uncharacterized protein with PhoU and TrkA domain